MSKGDELFLDGVLQDYPDLDNDKKVELIRKLAEKIDPRPSDAAIDQYLKSRGLL